MRREDDLRSALRTLALEAPDAEALIQRLTGTRAETRAGGPGGRRRWPGGRRLLAAVGSTAAIAIVAALSLTAANVFGNHTPTEPMPPQNVPGYYLAVGPTTQAGATYLAVIRRTVTGAAVATIQPPRPYAGFSDVTGAVDDRTFVVTAQTTNGYNNSTTVARLYLVKFNASDNAATMLALRIPEFKVGLGTLGTALSPDGTELPVATAPIPIGTPSTFRITIYSVASGHVIASWHTTGQVNPFSLTWSRGGILSFISNDGLRLLNTAHGSGNLLADSRHVYCGLLGELPYGFAGGFLTPDGTRIIAPRTIPVKPGERADLCNRGPNRWTLSEPTPGQAKYPFGTRAAAPSVELFSASTATALRVIYRSPSVSLKPSYGVSWSNPDGSVLVINSTTSTNPAAWAQYGVLRAGKFTPLPGLPHSKYLSEYTSLAF